MNEEERREYQRGYREKNRDKINARKREWYATHPEARAKQAAGHSVWQKTHKQHLKEYNLKRSMRA